MVKKLHPDIRKRAVPYGCTLVFAAALSGGERLLGLTGFELVVALALAGLVIGWRNRRRIVEYRRRGSGIADRNDS